VPPFPAGCPFGTGLHLSGLIIGKKGMWLYAEVSRTLVERGTLASVAFAVALAIGAVLCPIAGWAGRSLNLLDHPGAVELKIHRRAVPVTGGAAVLLASAVSAWIFGDQFDIGAWVGALIGFLVGTADDRRPLPPVARVGGVVLAAVAFVAVTPEARAAGPLWWLIALLLVLVCANAVNLVDGQDGLAGGLAAVAALTLSVLLSSAGLSAASLTAQALAGGLVGFLVWNRPPARIFLGNGGAYGVGALLGILAWFLTAVGGVRGFLAAGACLSPFAFEVVFTVARRIRGGAGLARGDRLHSYDLVARTAGRTASTIVFVILGIFSSGIGMLIWFAPLAGIPLAVVAALLAGLWGVLLWSRRPATT
jgi:UDP-GlcNAc:undecaprenyl-phosphate/decaprenyl-phosphate GlcNAc-1-phosphate transferase